MRKPQDRNTRYYIDVDLLSRTIVHWDYDNKYVLAKEELPAPFLHRVYISKGQYNKLVEKSLAFGT